MIHPEVSLYHSLPKPITHHQNALTKLFTTAGAGVVPLL